MAKRKNTAALFEVIARGDAKRLDAPAWVKPGAQAGQAADQPQKVQVKQPPGLDSTVPPAVPAKAVAAASGSSRYVTS